MSAGPAAGSRRRVRALLRKEFVQIRRDPSSLQIAFALPALLLLLFGFGMSLDAENVPLAVVVENPSGGTERFYASLANSRFLKPRRVSDFAAAERSLIAGRVSAIVVLRGDFSRRLADSGEAVIQVILNGTDANTARLVEGYLNGAWASWLDQERYLEPELAAPVVELRTRVWFNPELRSKNFIVPGVIAIIMTLTGSLLTAFVVAREWERGTMETMLVTPVTLPEFLAGKLIPYFLLGMGGMAVSVVVAIWVFGVPFRGSFLVLTMISALFLVTALALGLLISTIAKNQFVAGMIALVATFMPAFILSGFIFDIDSMPAFIQWLTYLVSARYFVSALQTLFQVGNVWSVLLPDIAALLIFAAVLIAITARKSSRRLE